MRTPIDIVMQNQAYYIEVHEGPSPFSTDAKDPWLTMAVVATITGARWRGHGELTGDEMQEIMNWCDEKSLVQRAKGRVVELRRRDKYTDFFVDNVQVKTISDFDVSGLRIGGTRSFARSCPPVTWTIPLTSLRWTASVVNACVCQYNAVGRCLPLSKVR